MSIYNCTISELQHFVMQPLILPILRVAKLHVRLLTFENVGFSHIQSHTVIIASVTVLCRQGSVMPGPWAGFCCSGPIINYNKHPPKRATKNMIIVNTSWAHSTPVSSYYFTPVSFLHAPWPYLDCAHNYNIPSEILYPYIHKLLLEYISVATQL